MNWKELLNSEIESTYATSDKLMGRVRENQLGWKPNHGENWMTTGQLLRHMTDACGMAMKGFATGDWRLPEGKDLSDLTEEEMLPKAEKMPTVQSVAEAQKLLGEDRQLAIQMVDQTSEEDLASKNSIAPWGGPDMILGHRFLQMIEHLKQHKAQLFYYLKLQGQPVNTSDLWGM